MRFVFAGLLLAIAAPSFAQTISLTPPVVRRWDGGGGVSSFAGHRGDLNKWDDWCNTGTVEVAAARYWTAHLRTEIRLGQTGEGRLLRFGRRRARRLRRWGRRRFLAVETDARSAFRAAPSEFGSESGG